MKQNRASFMKRTGVALGASIAVPAIIPSRVLGQSAPSNKITLGFIGLGGQGTGNLRMFLNYEDMQIITLCDAYLGRAETARKLVEETLGTTGYKVEQDFRTVLADPTIDAVVISTQDSWHVPMSIMALEAGKHVFCEKPTLCIEQGQQLIAAAKKAGKVYQVGIEDRSMIHFHKMVEWARNGALGTLRRIEVQLPGGKDNLLEAEAPIPADLDWNLWQGPAAWHSFTENRTKIHYWRYIHDYSKGSLLDWGTHLVDTAQLAANAPGICPVEVSGTGYIPEGHLSDVPLTFDLLYRYSNGVEMQVKSAGRPADSNIAALRFEGDKGWIARNGFYAGLEASDPAILQIRYAPGESCYGKLPPREQRDFLDAIGTGGKTTYTAEDMHLLSTTLHMGVIAATLNRKLEWDNKKQQFINDAEANKLCKAPEPRNWQKA